MTNPKDVARLVSGISEIADSLDIIYTESAPNGNISARQGRRAIYKNGATYEIWENTTGSTVWLQIITDLTAYALIANVVLLTGDQTIAGVKTFSSFSVTPSSAPTTDYQAANKKYVDDNAGKIGTKAVDETGLANAMRPYYDSASGSVKWNTFSNAFAAGSVKFAWSDTSTNTTSASYVKAKEILVGASGIITVAHDMSKPTASGRTNTSRIYVNGVGVGTERVDTSDAGGWASYSENISIVAGDLIQIYVKTTVSVDIRNFRLSCASFFGGIMQISTIGGSVVTEAP